MVVICAGTTGYNITMDLRYHWMMQKRFQGSHLANDEQSEAVNELLLAGKVDPCLSGTYSFDEIGHAHQLMYENKHPYGNMACLVNATETGQGATKEMLLLFNKGPWRPLLTQHIILFDQKKLRIDRKYKYDLQ